MTEEYIYGPIEVLTPNPVLEAELEITGLQTAHYGVTHVVFDEVHGTEVQEKLASDLYAGRFNIEPDGSGSVSLNVTKAVNAALAARPNFHISFLTQVDDAVKPTEGEHLFRFGNLEIHCKHPADDNYELSADVVHH
jgi:hypothetical protein